MSRRPLVPEAKEALDKLKTEYANEFGIKFNDAYKGNNTSKSNGHIGGPIGGLMTRKMVEQFEKKLVDK
ncbi:small, acid-soluble spore protein alpha [Clostridium homopropionicum DSM 5847]|uniref:Small, acid-soluble spore protein alpha n=1 Tax=Clostridium homopropionicum DSM 5847 TaxID=1121318 RepID=A0A0L6Z677_9CLOT|nr:alpha/beta-type small acid-soluble spore protein [Clostridium homopropionicum]KOA18465.1 small, acid-soluble spore protein alpha [Clostridium homopropionicum DSM 5847]SFF66314.1 Small, acid-soluble spore protein, alpha/beta type [Clostridium homopropionicum]